jgi:hypothetical protein
MNADQQQMTEVITWLRRLTVLCLLMLLVLIGFGMVLLRINLAALLLYVLGYGTLIFLVAYAFYKVCKFRNVFYQKQSDEASNNLNEIQDTEP